MLTRVPGAGSELMVLILQRLQGYNAFKHIRLPPGDDGLLSNLQQVREKIDFYTRDSTLTDPVNNQILFHLRCVAKVFPMPQLIHVNHKIFLIRQELLVEEITSIIRQEAIPLTFDGDVRFLSFSEFGRQGPTFISLVRNPLNPRIWQRYIYFF